MAILYLITYSSSFFSSLDSFDGPSVTSNFRNICASRRATIITYHNNGVRQCGQQPWPAYSTPIWTWSPSGAERKSARFGVLSIIDSARRKVTVRIRVQPANKQTTKARTEPSFSLKRTQNCTFKSLLFLVTSGYAIVVDWHIIIAECPQWKDNWHSVQGRASAPPPGNANCPD